MTFSGIFRVTVVAFLLGAFLGSRFPGSEPVFPLVLLFVGLGVIGASGSRRAYAVAAVSFSFALGLFLSARAESYWNRDREPISVSGTAEVIGRPETGEYFRTAVVRFVSCGSNPCPENPIEVRFPLAMNVTYGDRGTMDCLLEPPEPEWRMWYATRGIAYRCRQPEWEETGTTRPIGRALLGISSRFEESLLRHLPEPEAGLAAGLILGGDGRLPDGVRDEFRTAGLTHIVAVSGFNISIVAEYFLLLGILLSLSRKRAAPFSFLSTAAFVFVAGAPASAVRALLMAGTLMLAQWFGRRYESLFSLILVAAAMVFLEPLLLVHDVGFQLSFLATAGIVLSTPLVARIRRNAPKLIGPFLEAFLVTVAANLLLIPVLLSAFGRFVPSAIPVNTVLLPLVPFSMLLSFLVGLSGMVSSALGTAFSFPAYAILHLIAEGAGFGARFGDAAVVSDGVGPVVWIVWYGAVAWMFLRFRRRPAIREIAKDSLPDGVMRE